MRDPVADHRRIVILCDAVPELGMGHLARCSTLCRALRAAGSEADLLLLHGGRAGLVRLPGSPVRVMDTPPEYGRAAAEEVLALLPPDTGLLVADNYRLGQAFYAALRELRPGLAVMAYDDFGEKAALPILGVVNGGLSSRTLAYPGRFSLFSAVGLEYAALPGRCLAVPPRTTWNGAVSRVLLVMGGSDPEGQTLRLARLFAAMDSGLAVDVVLGPMFGDADPAFDALGPGFTVHRAPEDFLGLAARCDLAVTGGGSTCLELLYLGVPMAVLSLADNQDLMTACVESMGVGRALGRFDRIADRELEAVLRGVLADPEGLAERARRGRDLVDGRGAARLADRLAASARLFDGRGFAVDRVAEEYHRASFNAEHYEMGLWGSAEGMRNRFLLALELLGRGRVTSWLDVGCGPGDFLREARGVLTPERFVGLDLCARTLELAEESAAGVAERRFLAGDFMDPLDEGPFGLVTALGVLHKCGHSLDAALARLAELTAPGGRLLLTTKNLGWKRFDAPDFRPYAGHAWFLPEQVTAAMEARGLTGIEVRGFEPRTGRWVPLEEAHSMMLLATRGGAA